MLSRFGVRKVESIFCGKIGEDWVPINQVGGTLNYEPPCQYAGQMEFESAARWLAAIEGSRTGSEVGHN